MQKLTLCIHIKLCNEWSSDIKIIKNVLCEKLFKQYKKISLLLMI